MNSLTHFDIAGNGNHRSILFIHGMGSTRRWWHPQMADLSDTYSLIAPDLPGHGSRAGLPFDIESSLAGLAGLIDSHAGGRALVVGISLGGYLAMLLAGAVAEKVVGLVLSGCSMNMNGFAGLGMRLSGLMLKSKGAAWLEENQIRSFQKRIQPDLLEPVLAAGLFMETAIRNFSKVTGRDYHRRLAAFPGPVLVLNGAEDEPNRGPDEKLVRHLPNARLQILDDAGHLCSLEQPQAYSQAVRRFADRLPWQIAEPAPVSPISG